MLAAERGRTKLVRILVAARAHLDSVSDGTTALMRASAGGHAQIVRTLAAAGANVDLRSYTDTAVSRAYYMWCRSRCCRRMRRTSSI